MGVLTIATRALQLSVVATMSVWLFSSLGGVRLSPRPAADAADTNDTGQLFNWHPLYAQGVGCGAVQRCHWQELRQM